MSVASDKLEEMQNLWPYLSEIAKWGVVIKNTCVGWTLPLFIDAAESKCLPLFFVYRSLFASTDR